MKKSQASFEFLMTYGWAFLVITISLSAIIFFSISDPKTLVNSQCISEFGFNCEEFVIKPNNASHNGEIIMIVQNQKGLSLIINEFKLSDFEGITDCNLSNFYVRNKSGLYDISTSKVKIEPNEKFEVRINCSSGSINKNTLLKANFKMYYKPDKEDYFKKASNFNVVGRAIS